MTEVQRLLYTFLETCENFNLLNGTLFKDRSKKMGISGLKGVMERDIY